MPHPELLVMPAEGLQDAQAVLFRVEKRHVAAHAGNVHRLPEHLASGRRRCRSIAAPDIRVTAMTTQGYCAGQSALRGLEAPVDRACRCSRLRVCGGRGRNHIIAHVLAQHLQFLPAEGGSVEPRDPLAVFVGKFESARQDSCGLLLVNCR